MSADAMNARVKQLSDTTAAKAAEMDQSLLTLLRMVLPILLLTW